MPSFLISMALPALSAPRQLKVSAVIWIELVGTLHAQETQTRTEGTLYFWIFRPWAAWSSPGVSATIETSTTAASSPVLYTTTSGLRAPLAALMGDSWTTAYPLAHSFCVNSFSTALCRSFLACADFLHCWITWECLTLARAHLTCQRTCSLRISASWGSDFRIETTCPNV